MAVTMELDKNASSNTKEISESLSNHNLGGPPSGASSKSDLTPVEQTSSNENLKQYKCWVTGERWLQLKKIAENAMKDHKVFMIKGGGYPSVRRALLQRGWIEKCESHRMRQPPNNTDSKKLTNVELTRVEKLILFKLMEHHSVDFLWTTKRDRYDWLLSSKEVILSRFCRSVFTTKEGLTAALTQMHWYTQPGISNTRFPRCYNIHNPESLEDFIEDFRLTACISVLKWLLKAIQRHGEQNLAVTHGKVPFSALDFATNRVNEYIDFCNHKDIDEADDEKPHVWEHEWDQFLTYHYLLVHEKAKFIEDPCFNIKSMEKKSSKLLSAVSKHWPQMDIDGIFNIWIAKPGNKCRGRGIHLMNNIKDIIGLINYPNAQKTRYVVQKYIENPLIIYNTKFDIRQWFLVTNCQPLTIWIYKDCYLRFSSQMFSLSNYHESVHLTNNAVQHRYKNNANRDKALPDDNMWDSDTFKTYLRQLGKPDLWDTKIFPGIKESLIGAMLACQESMDKRPNSFELYGADFMLTEDFTPWLIEINSSPDLGSTTSVTARLCPQCLEDVIKVVLDRRQNPNADTGTFELAYRQVTPKAPAYLGLSLCLNGKRLMKKHKDKIKHDYKNNIAPVEEGPTGDKGMEVPEPVSLAHYRGPIITDFLTWLNPYDTLPMNKNNIVIPSQGNNSLTVRKAFPTIKSGKNTKDIPGKHKSSTLSSRTTKRRRGKNVPTSRRVTVHSCCSAEEVHNKKQDTKYHTESAKSEKPKIDRSVGNKRCYIDPEMWERETASILQSTISVLNKNVVKPADNFMPIRKSKSSSLVSKPLIVSSYSANSSDDGNSFKKITAVGTSMSKLRKTNRLTMKTFNFTPNLSYS